MGCRGLNCHGSTLLPKPTCVSKANSGTGTRILSGFAGSNKLL